jgi:hypothetical protein
MSAFKAARDAANRVRGCGPNVPDYDPAVPVGGRLDFSDVFLPIDATPEELAAQQRRAAVDAEAAADVFIAHVLKSCATRWRSASPSTMRAQPSPRC